MINLNKIDLNAKFPESVGMSMEKFQRLRKSMPTETKEIEKKLGFCIEEASIKQTVSEGIVAIWKKQGRTEISPEECVMSALLIVRKRTIANLTG